MELLSEELAYEAFDDVLFPEADAVSWTPVNRYFLVRATFYADRRKNAKKHVCRLKVSTITFQIYIVPIKLKIYLFI